MDAYTFLNSFFRGMTGQYIELTYIHPDKDRPDHITMDFVEVGNSAQLRDALDRASKLNNQGFGVYFGVCPRKSLPPRGKRGNEGHVDSILGFWTELDSVKEGRTIEGDLAALQSSDFVPSFCVLSGGGVHAYWMLDLPLTMADDKRQLIKDAIKGIGKRFGGDSVFDFARVMRVPGFQNTKPGRDNSPVTFVPPAEKHRYSIDQLLAFAPPVEPKKEYKRKSNREFVSDSVELATAALKVLAPFRYTDYAEWLAIGAALFELGPVGCQLWDEFSRTYPNYEEGVCEAKFKTFSGKSNLGALVKKANADYGGWEWKPKPPPALKTDGDLSVAPTDLNITYWTNGLPISLRAALATYCHPAVAPVLELWCEGIAAGIIPGREITTVQCLLKVAKQLKRDTTEATIRTGLNQGVGQFLVVLSHNSISIEEDHIQDQITVTDNGGLLRGGDCPCKNPLNAGREATYYELLTPKEILLNVAKLAIVPILMEAFPPSAGMVAPIRAEFLSALGIDKADELTVTLSSKYQAVIETQSGYKEALDRARMEYKRLVRQLANPESAPIPADRPYPNACQYIAATARAIIEAQGGETQFSIGKWCDKLGCTERNLKTILTRAGIRVLKQQNVDVPVKSFDQLKAMQPTYNTEVKGFPKAVVSSLKPDAPYGFTKKGMIAWAQGEIDAGATLSVRYHQANRQTIAPDTTPVIKPRLTYFQLLALKKILVYLISRAPTEDENEIEPGPKRKDAKLTDFPVVWRWNRLMRMSYMLAWYRHMIRPDVEIWTEKLAEKVSAWKVKGDKMIDQSAGEIRAFTPQAAIEALAEPGVSPPDNIPKLDPPAINGALLFNQWQSFCCPDKRDDWYSELSSAAKLALIEYRQTWADDPLVSALLASGGVVTEVIQNREAVAA